MNKYLEKVAVTRLVKEIAKGSFNITKGKLDGLVSKGALRSENQYVKGMGQGTDLLSWKHGVRVKHIDDSHEYSEYVKSYGGAAAVMHEGKPTAFIHKDFLQGSPLEKQIQHRHEIDEGRGALSDIRAGREFKQVIIQKNGGRDNTLSGAHNNLAILGRESTNISKVPHLHVGSDNNKFLRKFRDDSGEADTLKGITGKSYGSTYTSKDLTRLNIAKGNFTPEDLTALKGNYPLHHDQVDQVISSAKAVHVGDRWKSSK